MSDEFLTVAEVAEMLKRNQQTVRNMFDRGDLGAVRVGKRRVRVRQSQLDAFLAAGEMSHEAGPATRPGSNEDLWRRLQEGASVLATAAEAKDRDALERALSALSETARDL